MKLFQSGDQTRVMCENDGLADATFAYRDLPLNDEGDVAKDVLVAVCNVCGEIVAVPPQSTPAIRQAREKADISVEAKLPAAYLEALDLAIFRISSELTSDFRKPLVRFYLQDMAASDTSLRAVAAWVKFREFAELGAAVAPYKRFSMKISPRTDQDFRIVMQKLSLNKTDTLKSVVAQIHQDIVVPARTSKKMAKLRAFAISAA